MKKYLKLFALSLIAAFLLFSSFGVVSQTPMKDKIGVDFSEDFAIEIDFNGNFQAGSADLQVLKDFNAGSSNPQVNSIDQDEARDQQYFVSSFNNSGIITSYMALEKLEQDLTIGGYNLGHINASAPFQTLLQYYVSNGTPVLVANTFRGYVAYSTSPTDEVIDPSDDVYLGYTLVEKNLKTLLNQKLTAEGFGVIPDYGYEVIYDKTNLKFGMNYTNIFVAWQSSDSVLPGGISSSLVQGFEQIVTGGAIRAASLFEYLTFTYEIDTSRSNTTHTIVDVVTKYDVGPMKWLITRDNQTQFDNLGTTFSEINANSFHMPSFPVSVSLGGIYNWNENVPALSFYSGDAVSKRIDAQAMATSNFVDNGFGISVVTSTNVLQWNVDIPNPTAVTSDSNDPVFSFGNVFETSFVGKAHYTRTEVDDTKTEGLPVYVSSRGFDKIHELVNITSVIDSYFNLQSKQTDGFKLYGARQLKPFDVVLTNDINFADHGYVTFVQMPQWSGLEVVQDPTFSAVAAVAPDDSSSDTDTTDTDDTGTGSTTTTTSSAIPGFEFILVFSAIPVVIYYRKRK